MARVTVVILLAVGILAATSHGYELESAKRYVTRLWSKASNFLSKAYPTEDPRVPFLCERDGLFPNPSGCRTYVRCLDGVYSVVPCPHDQHFNPLTLTCQEPCEAHCDRSMECDCGWDSCATTEDGPDVVTTEERDDAESLHLSRGKITCFEDGRFPDPDNCSRYIECHAGRSRFASCPDGRHFSPVTRHCESPCVAQCDPDASCKWKSAIDKKAASDSPCQRDGIYGNPDDCTNYIQCSGGHVYVMPCPEDLHFSRETGRCETPCTARCDPDLAEECGWDGTTPEENDVDVCRRPPSKGPCDRNVIRYYFDIREGVCKKFVYGGCHSNGNNFKSERECSNRCLRNKDPSWSEFSCSSDGLFRNPESCSTYIQCSRGKSYVMPCPKGLHFSEETRNCDWPCDARCDFSIADECDGREEKSPGDNPIAKATLYDHVCVKDGNFRNTDDCGTYIQCKDGKATLAFCTIGFHYSVMTGKCDDPCLAHCDPDFPMEICIWYEGAPLKQPVFDFTCLRNGLFENHADCGTFIQCTGGSAYLISCRVGLHFNPLTKKCESPCEAGCEPGIEEKCKEDRSSDRTPIPPRKNSLKQPLYHEYNCLYDGLYPDPYDCTGYIQCSHGHSYIMHCPDWLHFSQYTRHCEAPCDAYCDSSLADHCGWDLRAYAPKSPKHDFVCEKDGPTRNPDDCTTYIRCSEGEAYVMSCPEGLHFSSESQRCLTPCEAKCDASSIDSCGDAALTGEAEEEIDCDLDAEVGTCKDSLPRFYFDSSRGRCTGFIYSGCGGNSNNFETEMECRTQCQYKRLGGFRCPANTGLFGHYPDCLSYFECKRGIAYLRKCPAGMAFDHVKSKCVEEYKATCVYQCPEKDGVYPYQEDCRKYIDCVNGVSKVMKCPAGTAFHPVNNDCVEVQRGQCALP